MSDPVRPRSARHRHLRRRIAATAGAEIANEFADASEEEMVMFLERDQLVSDKSQPVPRAHFSSGARLGLWALRIFALVVSAMVIYTFFATLG
jgi:hypothetical protein